MEKEEIKNGMQSIMSISLNYCHPSHPDVDDWHAVHSIAETVYNSLEDVYELELGVLLSKLEASGIDTSKLTIVEDGR